MPEEHFLKIAVVRVIFQILICKETHNGSSADIVVSFRGIAPRQHKCRFVADGIPKLVGCFIICYLSGNGTYAELLRP